MCVAKVSKLIGVCSKISKLLGACGKISKLIGVCLCVCGKSIQVNTCVFGKSIKVNKVNKSIKVLLSCSQYTYTYTYCISDDHQSVTPSINVVCDCMLYTFKVKMSVFFSFRLSTLIRTISCFFFFNTQGLKYQLMSIFKHQ